MTTLQSIIQFGDYIMPIGTSITSQQLDSTIEDQPMLGLDGAFAPSGYALGATIKVTIDMGGGGDVSPTTGLAMQTIDDVNNEANQLFERLKKGYQQLKIGTTPARYIMAQKRRCQVDPLPGSGRTHFTMTIEFYAQDPRWLSVATNTQAFSSPDQQFTVTNAGTARTYPVFTLTASTNNPVVQVGAAGTGSTNPYIKLTLAYTMATGDQIVIDCDPRNRANAIMLYPAGGGTPVAHFDWLGTTGVQNTMGTADCFPFLDPGQTIVWFGVGAGTIGTMSWHDAWGL